MKTKRIRCFWLYSFVLIMLTTIPYLIGFSNQSATSLFTGFVVGVEDGNSYIAKMLLGASGEWLFRTPYSTLPQRGVLAFLPYILLGKLAGGPERHLQLVALFHLFRAAAIPLAVWATYRFIELFLEDQTWVAWSTVVVTIGSGLGWLPALISHGALLGSLPLGFISPETFGFLAYLSLPHLVLARALLLISLRHYLESPIERIKAWTAGLTLALAGVVQPLTMIPAYAVIGMHQLLIIFRMRKVGLGAWWTEWSQLLLRILAVSMPVFLYFAVVFSTDPFLTIWTSQNRILSPHLVHYLLAYALMLPWVVMGVLRGWRSPEKRWLLLVGWVVLIPFLAYAPYNLQRRLPEGSWVAMVSLAALGLSQWKINGRVKHAIRTTTLVFSLVTPMMLVYGGMLVARLGRYPAFRTGAEIDAFNWLSIHAQPGSVVLAAFETGNAIPAWAPMRVVLGHGPETANVDALRSSVRSYFSGEMSASAQLTFMEEQRVDFVYYGPFERLSGGWDPTAGVDMHLVYSDGEYSIYRLAGNR